MSPTQSAIIVPVPEVEDLVSGFRARWDRAAGWGVPAHVTVLYPFMPPDRIDQEALRTLAAAVASVPVFTITLTRLSWFGDRVLWLAPEPDGPFKALTDAVLARFPEYPPYRGEHTENVPHLTVGHDAPIADLRSAAEALRPRLPVRATVTAVRLLHGSPFPSGWSTVADLPLGPAPAR